MLTHLMGKEIPLNLQLLFRLAAAKQTPSLVLQAAAAPVEMTTVERKERRAPEKRLYRNQRFQMYTLK